VGPDPVAPSRPCCGKTRQSKRPSSILIVQSRISGNLLSSLFIYYTDKHPTLLIVLGFWSLCQVEIMSFHCGWEWKSPQTALKIHIRHIQSVWAHWYAVQKYTVAALHSYTHTTWPRLRFLGSRSLCGVRMMCLRHGWGWQPPQAASPTYVRHMQSVWAHQYAVCHHMVAVLHSYTHTTWPRLRFLGSGSLCGIRMMCLRHGWGWHPPQTASPTYDRHMQSVWAHWYAVWHHMVAVLHSYTHTTWIRFCSKW